MPKKEWKLEDMNSCNGCPAFIHHKYINGGGYSCIFKYKIELSKDRPELCKLELGE